jgi:O-antigen/teichoic acid export membrane protein
MIWLFSYSTNPETVGEISVYFGVMSSLTIFFNLGLRNFLASDVQHWYSDSEYVLLKTLCLCLLILSSLILGKFLFNDSTLFFFVAAIKIGDSISDFFVGVWLRNGEAYRYGVSQMLKVFVLFLMILVYLFVGENDQVIIYLIPIGFYSVLIFYDLRVIKNSFLLNEVRKQHLKKIYQLARSAFPLALSSAVISLNISVPRVIVSWFEGSVSVAAYTYATYYLFVFTLMFASYLQTFISSISKNINKVFEYNFHKRNVYLLLIGGAIFIAFMAFCSDAVSERLYNFKTNSSIFVSVLLGFSGLVSILLAYLNIIFIAIKENGLLFLNTAANSLFYVVLTTFSVYKIGVDGAYYSIFFANLLLLVQLLLALRGLKVKWEKNILSI